MVAIVGPSGSGKSTMLHVIGALDRPSTGTVTIAGFDLDRLSDRQLSALRARTVGFVFQQFHLAGGVPALDNVADGLLYLGVRAPDPRLPALLALEVVRLGHPLHPPSHPPPPRGTPPAPPAPPLGGGAPPPPVLHT